MKIIITESQHNELLYSHIKEYVNDTLDENEKSFREPYIIIWNDNVGDYEDDTLIEYDYSDGRLWISKNYMYRLQNLIPLDKYTMDIIVRDCFEEKFNVKVSFVVS